MARLFTTYELTIANSGHGELDLSTLVSNEKTIRINPGATNVRLLMTKATSVEVADVHDYLLATAEESEWELFGNLSRLSFYNGSGGEVKVSIVVLF